MDGTWRRSAWGRAISSVDPAGVYIYTIAAVSRHVQVTSRR